MISEKLLFCELVLLVLMLPNNEASLSKLVEKCDDQCSCTNTAMTCKMYMPFVLPDSIQTLTVEDNANETDIRQFWTDNSWSRLQSLTLNNFTKKGLAKIYTFNNLINLDYFGLHSPELSKLENEQLKAMPNLKVLNLSGTKKLKFSTIISALSGGNLPNLEELNLDSVATDRDYTSMNIFGKHFISVLEGKPLKKIIVTNTLLQIDIGMLANGSIPTLEFLNISGPWIPSTQDIDESSIRISLKTLDLSVTMVTVFKTGHDLLLHNDDNTPCVINPFSQFLWRAENVYINYIFDMRVSFIKNVFNVTKCLENSNFEVKTKSLYCIGNGLKRLDINFVDNRDIGLINLDLSDNLLEYISPGVFKVMGSLETLNLSLNYLHKMESSKQFEKLFVHLKQLKITRLSNNRISAVPQDIFSLNKNLKEIDFSFNKILHIDFKILHLNHLKILNIAGNYIKFLDTGFLQKLDTLLIYPDFSRSDAQHARTKSLFLNDNPLQCSCQSVSFLRWLISRHNHTEEGHSIMCHFEGTNTTIDEDVVYKSKYLCIKAAVTLTIYISSVVLVVITVIFILVCFSRRLRRIKQNKVNRLIQSLKAQRLQKYLIFMSYCEDDETTVLDNIYPKLSDELHARVDSNEDLICVGNLKFRPGYPIHEEMVRCISESCIAVFIVSNAFFQSRWCESEFQEAATQNKPIFLILVNKIDEALMPPYLKTLFDRYTRVKVIIMGRHVELRPNVHIITQSLFELAADNQKYGGFYELFLRGVNNKRCVCC